MNKFDRRLAKNKICPCGHEKIITWIEPLRFQMGYEASCYGYSNCDKCGLLQTHYSGDLSGAIEFEDLMNDLEKSNSPGVVKH